MKSSLRMIGWLLLVAGLALAALEALARAGITPLGIDVFGRRIDTQDGSAQLSLGLLGVAALGAIMLYLTRRKWRHHA